MIRRIPIPFIEFPGMVLANSGDFHSLLLEKRGCFWTISKVSILFPPKMGNGIPGNNPFHPRLPDMKTAPGRKAGRREGVETVKLIPR